MRAILAALALLVPAAAQAAPVYRALAVTPLPAMPAGDFDQLAADVARNRLYVSAEDGATINVFDLATGALLRSGGAVVSPHKVAIDTTRNRLFVADGDGTVKVLGPDLATLATIPVGAKADTGVLDPVARVFYVGSREGAGDGPNSVISAISLDTLTVTRRFIVPATTLKGLILDRAGNRLLVSLRDKDAIAVIHLSDGRIETWTPPGLHRPVPLAIDARHGQLLAGARGPGRLLVLDARDGQVRQALASTETSDSIALDPATGAVFLSGDSGMSRYAIGRDGAVRLVSTDPMLVGKTSLYVPENHRLYVMRPKTGTTVAALQVFAVEP